MFVVVGLLWSECQLRRRWHIRNKASATVAASSAGPIQLFGRTAKAILHTVSAGTGSWVPFQSTVKPTVSVFHVSHSSAENHQKKEIGHPPVIVTFIFSFRWASSGPPQTIPTYIYSQQVRAHGQAVGWKVLKIYFVVQFPWEVGNQPTVGNGQPPSNEMPPRRSLVSVRPGRRDAGKRLSPFRSRDAVEVPYQSFILLRYGQPFRAT